jgi:AraC-like DNA-binding protein
VETPATGEAATMGDNGQPSKTYKHRIRKWMLDDINRIIETNLDNDNFKACDLAKGLNYCTMQVHRIVKELTNLPTAYYIRRYRLLKSQGYLSNGKYNVSEVAYMVGFKSPEHFARCFRDEFGECPSNYRHRMSASGI